MKLIKANEGQRYEAAHHFNYWSMNKINPDNLSKRLNIGISYFLPGYLLGDAPFCLLACQSPFAGTLVGAGSSHSVSGLDGGITHRCAAAGEKRFFPVRPLGGERGLLVDGFLVSVLLRTDSGESA